MQLKYVDTHAYGDCVFTYLFNKIKVDIFRDAQTRKTLCYQIFIYLPKRFSLNE